MREVLDAFRKQGLQSDYISPLRIFTISIKIIFLSADCRIRFTIRLKNPGLMAHDKAQLKELLTNYGKIDIFFFDGPEEGLKEYAWQLQPDLVVTRGQMQTPEQNLPDKPVPRSMGGLFYNGNRLAV